MFRRFSKSESDYIDSNSKMLDVIKKFLTTADKDRFEFISNTFSPKLTPRDDDVGNNSLYIDGETLLIKDNKNNEYWFFFKLNSNSTDGYYLFTVLRDIESTDEYFLVDYACCENLLTPMTLENMIDGLAEEKSLLYDLNCVSSFFVAFPDKGIRALSYVDNSFSVIGKDFKTTNCLTVVTTVGLNIGNIIHWTGSCGFSVVFPEKPEMVTEFGISSSVVYKVDKSSNSLLHVVGGTDFDSTHSDTVGGFTVSSTSARTGSIQTRREGTYTYEIHNAVDIAGYNKESGVTLRKKEKPYPRMISDLVRLNYYEYDDGEAEVTGDHVPFMKSLFVNEERDNSYKYGSGTCDLAASHTVMMEELENKRFHSGSRMYSVGSMRQVALPNIVFIQRDPTDPNNFEFMSAVYQNDFVSIIGGVDLVRGELVTFGNKVYMIVSDEITYPYDCVAGDTGEHAVGNIVEIIRVQ